MRYAIGDVHGCNASLKMLLQQIGPKRTDEVYFVGDLIDRGTDSKGVIDTIFDLKKIVSVVKCCRGNHEQLMFDSVKGETECAAWLRNGGDATMRSFHISSYDEMPEEYRLFFKSMEYYIDLPSALIVHASFNFDSNEPFDDTHAMLWSRTHRCDLSKTGNRPVIHGHTPVPFSESLEMITQGNGDINIDTGCVYSERPGMGHLTALRIDDMKLISVLTQEV